MYKRLFRMVLVVVVLIIFIITPVPFYELLINWRVLPDELTPVVEGLKWVRGIMLIIGMIVAVLFLTFLVKWLFTGKVPNYLGDHFYPPFS